MRRRMAWHASSLAPFLVFLAASAASFAIGGLALWSRLPELPHGRALMHDADVRTFAEVLTGVWLLITALAIGLWAWFARRNSLIRASSQELLATTRELEQSLLHTIETLNAAVEARDPYTAGHSQRVRRVALAVGRALSLPADRLGGLGTAALFHDIGKIGMPDSILTKTEHPTRDERALMREHVTRGAEIVAKFPQFRAAIPAIRHHPERWNGLGYPDGLSADAVPLEAAIIGLADAWDAMTTDRPYSSALTLNEAMLQIRGGREKQFNPAVVDAFWEVARRRPADVLPPDAPSATIVAV
jgi:putative nucleotidyltransferase with HDIG domain